MADPFVGEIRAVAFNYAPEGWLLCSGQVLPVSQYQALFALLGNMYGGDGVQNFALPDLRGRSIVHVGAVPALPPVTLGQNTGAPMVLLSASMLPAHTHQATFTDPGHTHSISGVPPHTHSFAVPCSDGTGSATTVTPSPVGAFPSASTGIDANLNIVVGEVNAVADVVASSVSAVPGAPFPTLSDTPLYAKSSNNTMGGGTTGPAVGSGSVPSGAAQTGATVAVVPTPAPTTAVPTLSPGLGLYYIIATVGIWPPRC